MDESGKNDNLVIPLPSEGESVTLLGEKNEVKGYINSKRPRHFKGGLFMIIFQDGLDWLAKQDIKGKDLKVLLKIMAQLDFDNYWHVEQKYLAEEMGMDRSNLSKAIKRLVSLGILYKDERKGKSRSYRLNPTIAHKGAKNYKATLADYRNYQKAQEGKEVETEIISA